MDWAGGLPVIVAGVAAVVLRKRISSAAVAQIKPRRPTWDDRSYRQFQEVAIVVAALVIITRTIIAMTQ